jgi:hypothetical protein
MAGATVNQTHALAIREADEGEELAQPVPGGGNAPDEVLVPALRSSALGEAKPKSNKPKDCYF